MYTDLKNAINVSYDLLKLGGLCLLLLLIMPIWLTLWVVFLVGRLVRHLSKLRVSEERVLILPSPLITETEAAQYAARLHDAAERFRHKSWFTDHDPPRSTPDE